MKKLNLLPFILFTPDLFAADIDLQGAYRDALGFQAIKFVSAAVMFYLLSLGLLNKPKDTAMKTARWFASILVAFSIIAFPNKYEIDRNLFEMALASVGWCLIGFITGYLWFKFKHIKNINVDIINVKTWTNKKVLLPILALVSVGVGVWGFGYSTIGKGAIYNIYPSCKDTSKDCTQPVAVYITFKVDKEKSQVIQIVTQEKEKTNDLRKLDNCVVLDEYNWQCTDNATDAFDNPYKYTMTDSEVSMSDSTYTQILNGKVTTKTYYGYTFVKR